MYQLDDARASGAPGDDPGLIALVPAQLADATAYADVGVIVAESERGRGLATRILAQLVAMNESKGLASICSTEKRNVAAQKAITRAGFSARNRIVRFDR